jgi:hypothetical protein
MKSEIITMTVRIFISDKPQFLMAEHIITAHESLGMSGLFAEMYKRLAEMQTLVNKEVLAFKIVNEQ